MRNHRIAGAVLGLAAVIGGTLGSTGISVAASGTQPSATRLVADALYRADGILPATRAGIGKGKGHKAVATAWKTRRALRAAVNKRQASIQQANLMAVMAPATSASLILPGLAPVQPTTTDEDLTESDARIRTLSKKLVKEIRQADSATWRFVAAPPTPEEIAQAHREQLLKLTQQIAAREPNLPNGNLPDDVLCTVNLPGSTSFKTRCDAEPWLEGLAHAYYEQFGEVLQLNSGYRTLQEQGVLVATKGSIAAPVGESRHGDAKAVDLRIVSDDRYQWLLDNSATYCWNNPSWARVDGVNPERWHYEFDPECAAAKLADGTAPNLWEGSDSDSGAGR